jgi:hypothetical protein
MKEIIDLHLDELKKIEKNYPNDQDLGKSARILLNSVLINKHHPNDLDLGKILRKYLKENLTIKKNSLSL